MIVRSESAEEPRRNEEMKYELMIQGMMCGHCQKHVNDALSAMEGVSAVEVNLIQGLPLSQQKKRFPWIPLPASSKTPVIHW